jgi:GAF domain-containing protein
MDRINVLGNHNERYGEFTKELLSETNDAELQQIVEQAAAELKSPIALVSLILDQVQFFKAHIGLPPVLASARGTHCDVSFCQFVVRDGKTFEVNDAANDPRVPQHVVKEYNIQSYLGVPIKINNTVMGSLCVLDTKKRSFSPEDHNTLNELSKLVNVRLEAITTNRRHTRLDLTEATLKPVIAELSKSLKSIQDFIKSGYSAGTAIRSFLNHFNHLSSDESKYFDAIKLSLEAATKANQLTEDLLLEIELAVLDNADCINALEQMIINTESTSLSELVIAAQDLSRNATNLVGGFHLPDFESDPLIYTKGNLAIAILTNCLLFMASELGHFESRNGITLNSKEQPESVELLFSAIDLNNKSYELIASNLIRLIRNEQLTVLIDSTDEAVRLKFRTLN